MRSMPSITYRLFAVWSLQMLFTGTAFAATACSQASSAFGDATSAYLKGGAQAFVDRFLHGSAFPVRVSTSDAVSQLKQIEAVHGAVEGWSPISLKELGARSCYLVGILEYANGPAFAGVLYYITKDGPAPVSIRLEGEPDKVFSAPALIDERSR